MASDNPTESSQDAPSGLGSARFDDAESRQIAQRYRRRLTIGVVLLVILAVPAVIHTKSAMDGLVNRPPNWLPDDLPEKVVFNRFMTRFDLADLLMVSWEGADLQSPQLDAAAAMVDLLSVEGVATADGTVPIRLVNNDDVAVALPDGYPVDEAKLTAIAERINEILVETRTVSELSPPPTDETGPYHDPNYPIIWVRSGEDTVRRMMASPANFPRGAAQRRLEGSIVGPDGEQTCLLIALTDIGATHRRSLLPQLRSLVAETVGKDPDDPTEIVMVGGPIDGATVDDASVRSVEFFAPPSAIVAALMCFLCLRSLPLTATIVSIAVVCEGLVLAIVYYTGTPMNAVLIVLPPLVFVLTISSGIHLSNYYFDAAEEFADLTPALAAKRALRAGMVPCLLAVGTTVVGLGSLTLVRLHPIRVFGFVASIGVSMSLLLLLWCLPGAMVMAGFRNDDPKRPKRPPRFVAAKWLTHWLAEKYKDFVRARLARPWPMIFGFALITLGAGQGLTQLESSVSVPRMFLPDSFIRTQYDWFEENIGATVSGDLLVTFPKPPAVVASGDGEQVDAPESTEAVDLVDPLDQLRIVQAVHKAAIDEPRISSVLSAASFIPPVSRSRGLAGSASRTVARSLIRDPDSSLGSLGFISHSDDDYLWRLSFRLPQKVEADYGSDLSRIDATANAALADALAALEVDPAVAEKIDVDLTGQVAIIQKAQEVMLRDLFRSFLAAFGVVAVVMVLLLKSVQGGLIAMIPNLFPTVTIFGLMGLIRSPLDIGSVMTASVALGIAVDDTVHLLSRFGSRRARGLSLPRSALGALDQCGIAMLETTMICGLSLMVYWFSDFVPTSHFAVLMFSLLSAALFGDVFLLPAMMASPLGNYLSRTVGSDPEASLTHESAESTDNLIHSVHEVPWQDRETITKS
ncbi:efflux RND transporter permease subunit [Crateriforma spongiae]|uniref:efflux RND transporter permease subunit n=1 Tax=Crateriforma spongiae TaxID=2724528 RepID=UPI001445C1AF|nr:MMPL family transporter [Crateriforma spongiae]